MTSIKKEFIKNLQGKDFVLFAGLLDLAHQQGLKKTEVIIMQYPSPENGDTCIVQANVETERGSFMDIGDASPKNVKAHMIPHLIRMASTRAIARALRQATNVAMCSFEEMGLDDDDFDAHPIKAPARSGNGQGRPLAKDIQKNAIWKVAREIGHDKATFDVFIRELIGCPPEEMNTDQATKILANLQNLKRDGVKIS